MIFTTAFFTWYMRQALDHQASGQNLFDKTSRCLTSCQCSGWGCTDPNLQAYVPPVPVLAAAWSGPLLCTAPSGIAEAGYQPPPVQEQASVLCSATSIMHDNNHAKDNQSTSICLTGQANKQNHSGNTYMVILGKWCCARQANNISVPAIKIKDS